MLGKKNNHATRLIHTCIYITFVIIFVFTYWRVEYNVLIKIQISTDLQNIICKISSIRIISTNRIWYMTCFSFQETNNHLVLTGCFSLTYYCWMRWWGLREKTVSKSSGTLLAITTAYSLVNDSIIKSPIPAPDSSRSIRISIVSLLSRDIT